MLSYNQILENLNKNDNNVREQAQKQAEEFRRGHPVEFIDINSKCLGDTNLSIQSKVMAGILMKNCVENKNQELEVACVWQKMDPKQKDLVRNTCISALAAQELLLKRTVGQCVAILAKQDIPKGEWLECVDFLVYNSKHSEKVDKEAAILTIGYICEELKNINVSKQISDKFLFAICERMSNVEVNHSIKILALLALDNAISFFHQNFETPREKDYVINLVCNCFIHPRTDVRYYVLKVLSEIGTHYYDKIQSNLPNILVLTLDCLQFEKEKNQTMALEFWLVVAQEEIERKEVGEPGKDYIKIVSEQLTIHCLEKLHNRSFEEEWSLDMAYATMLNKMIQISGENIFQKVMTYI